MSVITVLNYITLMLLTFSAFTAAVMMIKRNPKLIVNRIFFVAYCFYAVFGASMWISLSFPVDLVAQIFVRITLISAVFAQPFLYFGTMVVFHSETVLNKRMVTLILGAATIMSVLFILYPNLVVLVSPEPGDYEVDSLIMFGVLVWVAILVVRVIVYLWRLRRIVLEKEEEHGKKSLQVKKMEIIIWAHSLGLFSSGLLVILSFFNVTYRDIIFYMVTCLDFTLTAYAVLRRK